MPRSARRTRRSTGSTGPTRSGAGGSAYLNVEPMLDGLRGDPRFARFMERMRLA